MKGTTQFRRKDQEMFLDKFRVVAVTTLEPSQFEYFSKHLLDNFSFIEKFADELCVREDGYADSLLVLNSESEDGILVNSEGAHYARYSSFLPYAKPMLKKQIKEIVDEIIEGRFGELDKGNWYIGFDDIKEHFDLTVTKENGIGELIIEELESREEVDEIIASEDAIEITEYLNEVPESATREERLMTLFSLIGCNLEDVHLVDDDVEHELATIVELNQDTLTEQGKKDWADVLSAKVVKIFEGDYGVQISITGCDAERVKDFSYMLAGYCSDEDYRKWVTGEEEKEVISTDDKVELSDQEIRLKCAKHLLWLNDEEGGEKADFSNCHIKNKNLADVNLNSAGFNGCVIENCILKSAELNFADMTDAKIMDTNLSYTTMDEAVFRGAELHRCNLSQVIAYHANFAQAVLDKCDLFNSHFHNSCFDETAFKKTNVADSDIDLDNVISEETWKNPDVGIVM